MPLPHDNSQNQNECSGQGKRKQGSLGRTLNRSCSRNYARGVGLPASVTRNGIRVYVSLV